MIDISPWSGLRLVEQVVEGNRNEVWRGEIDGLTVAVRRSRRTTDSLAWELELVTHLASLEFVVPQVIAADDGSVAVDAVVVQRWIDGTEPATDDDWHRVAGELQRLHQAMIGYRQRPTCCACFELAQERRSVDADLDAMPTQAIDVVTDIFAGFVDRPITVIHGDPDPSNLRMTPDGRVGLLDWDESRVDVTWHDLSNLGVQVLDDAEHVGAVRLSNAWEAANAWTQEPSYARRRFAQLS